MDGQPEQALPAAIKVQEEQEQQKESSNQPDPQSESSSSTAAIAPLISVESDSTDDHQDVANHSVKVEDPSITDGILKAAANDASSSSSSTTIPTPRPTTTTTTTPILSRLEALKARVALDARDSEAWMALLDDAHAKATGSQGLGAGEGTWKGVGIVAAGSNKRSNTGGQVANPSANGIGIGNGNGNGNGSDPNSLMVGDLDHLEEGLSEAREVYDAFFKVFPNAVSWDLWGNGREKSR